MTTNRDLTPFEQLIRPAALALEAYVPGMSEEQIRREYGLDTIVKLASNENPLGPSPRAVNAVSAYANTMHRYPEPTAPGLQAALARQYGLSEDQIVFSNGEDNIITLLTQTFLGVGDEVVTAWPTFSSYRRMSSIAGATITEVPLRDDCHDLAAMQAAFTPATKLVFVCNPNNPTGTVVTEAEIDRLVEALPAHALLVLDEAYIEYVHGAHAVGGLKYVQAGAPVLVLRTFSKFYGLAGMRIGCCFGPASVVRHLANVREAFAAGRLGQVAAEAALADSAYTDEVMETNTAEREFLAAELTARGWRCTPSGANFIWAEVGGSDGNRGQALAESLLRHGVIVRPGGGWGYPHHLRISIGLRHENEALLAAVDAILG